MDLVQKIQKSFMADIEEMGRKKEESLILHHKYDGAVQYAQAKMEELMKALTEVSRDEVSRDENSKLRVLEKEESGTGTSKV